MLPFVIFPRDKRKQQIRHTNCIEPDPNQRFLALSWAPCGSAGALFQLWVKSLFYVARMFVGWITQRKL